MHELLKKTQWSQQINNKLKLMSWHYRCILTILFLGICLSLIKKKLVVETVLLNALFGKLLKKLYH